MAYLMQRQVFGSNGFHGNSVLKDIGAVLHEIVRANYVKLLPMNQSSQFNTQLEDFQWLDVAQVGCVGF